MERIEFETFSIHLESKDHDFTLARAVAERIASGHLVEPMLIAWYDGIKNEEHPEVPECQHKPGWLAYAEGHGGRVRVDVNGKEYSFIFAESGKQ